MLAMLLGCGLRRSELAELEVDEVQTRQGHWAIVDLSGKGGHIVRPIKCRKTEAGVRVECRQGEPTLTHACPPQDVPSPRGDSRVKACLNSDLPVIS
jgi:hypothetical protein